MKSKLCISWPCTRREVDFVADIVLKKSQSQEEKKELFDCKF